MKTPVIKSIKKLLKSSDPEKRMKFQKKSYHLILTTHLGMDPQKETVIKNLILNTINNYVRNNDECLKGALTEHMKMLESIFHKNK